MGNSCGMCMEVRVPWQETRAMDEKMRFVIECEDREVSFSELCRRYGISRRCGYKLVGRYRREGIEGLKERSRAPHHHPNGLSAEVEAVVVEVRRSHPSWGPKKIDAWLEAKHPGMAWPAQSTIGTLLDRHGLVKRRRARRRVPPGPSPLSASLLANDVWGVDFKGWFRTGDGQRCDPLSLSDLATRYVLRLQAVERCDGEHVWPLFDAAFREFGLPRVMRSDNGPPFAGTGVGGLSALAVQLIKAGVIPERIAPGKPQQNGRHERMHLTLLQEVANPPANSLREQIKRLRDFQRFYNEERPHQALDNATPAERYQASPRRFDGILREPDYDDDRMVRRVRHNGEIKLNGNMIYISAALVGEPIGLAEDQQGWTVSYGPLVLGTIAHRGDRLRKPKRKGRGLEDNAARCPQGPQPTQQQ